MRGKVLLALVATAFAGSALAAAPAFEEVDADANGSISAEEAASVEGLDFATADTNGDGSLSKEEYEAATAAM